MSVSGPALTALMAELASLPGLHGCALVEAETGFVWTAQGRLAGQDGLWEAATDFWRLQMRNARHFAELGEFGAAVMHHTAGMLAVFRCCREPEVLFVAVGRQGAVDWINLQRRVARVGRVIAPRSSLKPTTSSSTA
jgi:hypothetical protein